MRFARRSSVFSMMILRLKRPRFSFLSYWDGCLSRIVQLMLPFFVRSGACCALLLRSPESSRDRRPKFVGMSCSLQPPLCWPVWVGGLRSAREASSFLEGMIRAPRVQCMWDGKSSRPFGSGFLNPTGRSALPAASGCGEVTIGRTRP